MRAAAWSQIEVGDLNHAQLAFAGWLFAQRQRRCLFGGDLANLDRTTFPDDLIGKIYGLLDSLIRSIVERDIDLAFVLKHTKAARGRGEQPDQGRGKNVLTRVLLHMIKPSQPVNFPVNCLAHLWHWSLNHVQDACVLSVNAINYSSLAK